MVIPHVGGQGTSQADRGPQPHGTKRSGRFAHTSDRSAAIERLEWRSQCRRVTRAVNHHPQDVSKGYRTGSLIERNGRPIE